MKLNDSSLITFGKYKGRRLMDIPPDYLMWLYNDVEGHWFNSSSNDVREYINKNLETIKDKLKYDKK